MVGSVLHYPSGSPKSTAAETFAPSVAVNDVRDRQTETEKDFRVGSFRGDSSNVSSECHVLDRTTSSLDIILSSSVILHCSFSSSSIRFSSLDFSTTAFLSSSSSSSSSVPSNVSPIVPIFYFRTSIIFTTSYKFTVVRNIAGVEEFIFSSASLSWQGDRPEEKV